MKKLVSVIDNISIFAGKATSWVTIVVIITVIYEISMRYALNLPTLWASETMVFGCGVLYVLGSAWALQDNRHVKIDVIYGRLSKRQRAVMDSVTFVFFTLYIVVLIWASAKYAGRSLQLLETTGSAWDPPVYPIKIALVLGVVLLMLQGIAKFIRDLHLAVKGSEL
jgi:TRAP-type mannitol/chloroaromatic compound transport system permease small subunit